MFSGRLRSRVSCPACRHNSDTFDPCLDLSLDIRHAKSVNEALDVFTKAEELSGSGRDRYRCEGSVVRPTCPTALAHALPAQLPQESQRFKALHD